MQSEEIEPQTEKATTIKVPADLKAELDRLKEDEKETYAGVIERLIQRKTPDESNSDAVTISLPRRVYKMMLMLLPGNLSDQLRKGVR
jgi:predicted CopG family antitoxin